MAKENKILDEQQLEEVSGGGYLDTKALEDALFDPEMEVYPDLANVYNQAKRTVPDNGDPVAYKDALAKEMLAIMGIDATITQTGGNNIYYYKDRQISQSDVLWVVKGYKESRLYRRNN